MINGPFPIKAVLFDFDGTLTKPGALDFPLLKDSIGCPPDIPVLEFIESLPTSLEKEQTLSSLERFETKAAALSEPNDGAENLIHYLLSMGLGIGIITRNGLSSIERALQNFQNISISSFDVIISRNTPVKPKPSGDSVRLAAQKLNLDVKEVLMVGDYIFDIQAGKSAGCMTAFLDYGTVSQDFKIESHFTISRLKEIKNIVRLGMPLRVGKLPNDILKQFLNRFDFQDPSVLIGAGVGEDTAAVNIDPEEVLVLKSDPITFATDSMGHYAVLINANDIATAGAKPRWLLTTLLFPPGTLTSAIWEVMHDLESSCRQWDITLCGGHTEITDAVTRPVIIGMLAGTVSKRDLIDKRNMEQGDIILLTKAVGVEGTAIIAREFADRLKELDMLENEIEQCRQFLSLISVLKEAEIAGSSVGVSAMHDITEGGLATALNELSIAGHHKIRVCVDRIPVYPQTQKICRLLHMDPIGLIGSGSLLICCSPGETGPLMDRIQDAGIQVTSIGTVLESGVGIQAFDKGRPVKWPGFEVDEITRLYKPT
jgi:hydrogenase expression/formation protein HypE